MKTEWDYTKLAQAYISRPSYADAAIDGLLTMTGIRRDDFVCDIGAGVAHLTRMLAARGLRVTAIEPNDAMRERGIKRTEDFAQVRWFQGTGERTGQGAGSFDLVTFGSSFNVCDRPAALTETARILKPRGWFACMWNHRQLDDPIQTQIEAIIRDLVPSYGYGTRREDQTGVIDASGLFCPVVHLDSRVTHEQSIAECVEAWRSHATLERQAGVAFHSVIEAIEKYLTSLDVPAIKIPYATNIWIARLR
ncbi:MAG: class I SAM-dependent methyltransferase [Bryobacteraceae bacterium]